MSVREVPEKLIHVHVKSTFALSSLCFSLEFSSAFFRIQIFMWLMGFRNQRWSAVFPATTWVGPYMCALSGALCDL